METVLEYLAKPVDRFCDLLAEFPSDQRESLASAACMLLGYKEERRQDVPYNDDLTHAELYRTATYQDLRTQLMKVVGQSVDPQLLIVGLLYHLTEEYEYWGNPIERSARIDANLDLIRELKENKAKPIAMRRGQLDDASLDRMIQTVENTLSENPAKRIEDEAIAIRLRELWEERFDRQYWTTWRLDEN